MFEGVGSVHPLEKALRLLSILVSLAVHLVGFTVVLVVPLLFFHLVPEIAFLTFLADPPLPPPALAAPSPPPGGRVGLRSAPKYLPIEYEPVNNPKGTPAPMPEPPEDWQTATGGTEAGVGAGTGTSGVGPLTAPLFDRVAAAPPALPPPPAPVRPKPLRVGGDVQASRLVHRVDPKYPELARLARVSGIVILDVLVDEEGNVSDIRVLQGHRLLEGAAVEAVKQWKYSPTLLNGEPVPVTAAVTVIFSLR